jgi:hypothetical protein
MTRRLILALAIPLSTHAAEKISFNRDIRPILSENCFYCHGPDAQKQKAELRLDLRDAALKGGESGKAAIQPGKPTESEVIKHILSTDPEEHMPPKKSGKTLKPEQIELLKQWIAEGAEYQGHWAFLKPQRPVVPEIRNPKSEIRNPIDAFVYARLEKEKLAPSPEAARETLIRRVSLDLTGIPPTPEEVDAFLNDRAPDAYEKVVDRLLASPRYGERMAAQWLDFARYADSNGFQEDSSRQMFSWRDWVIGAFNRNMPFDQFTIEQLAGDILPNATTDQIVATGFNRNHRLNGEGGRIVEEWFTETVIDRVETTGQTWMALTLGCCRCHDHKFDPVSQKEFYQLYAFFNSNEESGVLEARNRGNTMPFINVPTPEQTAQIAKLEKEITDAESQKIEATKELPKLQATWEEAQLAEIKKAEEAAALQPPTEPKQNASTKLSDSAVLALKTETAKRTDAQKAELTKLFTDTNDTPVKQAEKIIVAKKKERDGIKSNAPTTMVMKEIAQPRAAHILKRGEYDKKGDAVERGLPAALPPMPAGAPMNRLGFAQWLVSGEHPLTARVWVNRAWERFFGTGLVRTSENFGSQAEWPSHPELLDWLATEFVRLKWDMKAMQKTIVMSATYRQSARSTPTLIERDPDNRLLARGPRFRLTGEALRDQALAVSGLLVEKVGGPSVKPYMPPAVWDETSVYGDMRGYKSDTGEGLYRRSLYTIWKRTAAPPSMLIFDSATREICTVKRSRTNTPLQALSLLNEITYVEAARRLAERMLTEGGATTEDRITWGFRRATSRRPDPTDLKVLTNGVEQRLVQFRQNAESAKQLLAFGESKPLVTLDSAELAAYSVAANVILNLDEVITRE